MSGNSRHSITRDGSDVGTLYEMPSHGKVCLHTRDADLVGLLVAADLVTPRRPPFLDAAEDGVHGAYRPRPQINLFFEDPVAEVIETIRPTLEESGYRIVAETAPGPSRSGTTSS